MALQSYFNSLTDQIQGEQLETAIQHKWSILAGTVAAYAIYKYLSRPKNLPPGPKGLPILGALMDLTPNLHTDWIKFSQQYKSDIISFYTGGQLQVVLNSADAIKMAFMHTDDFSHRDPGLAQWMDSHDKVFVASYSAEQKWIKSFSLTSLKTHGFSTIKLEQNVKLQLTRMICHLECLPDHTIGSDDIRTLIAKAGACVVMKYLASVDYEFDDPELDDVVVKAQNLTASIVNAFVMSFTTNMLPSVLVWFMKKKHVSIADNGNGNMVTFLQVLLEEHKDTLDVDNPRDFMDDFLILKVRNPSLTDREVLDTIVQFSPDGIDTFSSLVTWILYLVCCHPDIQNKMLNEIKSVCGDTQPSTKDRSKMTYCDAVIIESMRMSSVFPFTPTHRNDKDAQLGGYFIPKETILLGNLYAVHYDERVFPEPTKFKPDRFLTSQGQLANVENVMVFGIGQRKCIGGTLVKSESFVYVTGLVQKFQLSFPEGHEPPPCKFDDIDRLPPAHKMKFTARY